MKGGHSNKTKVVVRHLPPTLSQAALIAEIDVVFSGRYNWLSFRPGKASQKNKSYSRAYIDFRRPEDVIDFAEFFNGHLFVNEKGSQFKAVVEYAPSQCVPHQRSKKDGCEGTIHKDPVYLEFLDFISKPVENLPSAEIQLERKEAEKSGAPKDSPIVTPLMDFVRQKRAAKSGSRCVLSNGKLSRKATVSGTPSSSSAKRGSEKKRMSSTMYVVRDSAKNTGVKNKSTNGVVPQGDDEQISSKVISLGSLPVAEVLNKESGISGLTDLSKTKILLLKGKEKEISPVSGNVLQQQNLQLSDNSATNSTILKQNLRPEASGRMRRSILLNKDSCHNQSSGSQSERITQLSKVAKDKCPPRPLQVMSKDNNGISDGKVVTNDHGFPIEKQEKRFRNRERPDRVVWTPLRRSDGSFACEESSSSQASHSMQLGLETSRVNLGDIKVDISTTRSREAKLLGSGRSRRSSSDNGSHKHFGRYGPPHIVRDTVGSTVAGKPSKRGNNSGYGSHEKQVWVQKSSFGS